MPRTRGTDAAQFSKALNGYPEYKGVVTVVAATPKDNSTTAVTFTLVGGELLLLQSDVAAYVYPGPVTDANAVSAKMVKIDAGEKFYLLLPSATTKVTFDSVSGTANIKVFELI